jgi:hypothetical protein
VWLLLHAVTARWVVGTCVQLHSDGGLHSLRERHMHAASTGLTTRCRCSLSNVELALKARYERIWATAVPADIFLNYGMLTLQGCT